LTDPALENTFLHVGQTFSLSARSIPDQQSKLLKPLIIAQHPKLARALLT
jgi:hypothetical protein